MAHFLRTLAALLVLGFTALSAHAAIDPALLKPLAGDDADARIAAVVRIAALANDDARKVLMALKDDSLYATPQGDIVVVTDDSAWNPATGATGPLPEGIDGVVVNNRLRGAVDGALSGMALLSPDVATRRAAAQALLQSGVTPEQLPLVARALAVEKDPDIKATLQSAKAVANLGSTDAAVRKAAVIALADTGTASLRPQLQAMLEKNADGSHAEPDGELRLAVANTLNAIDSRASRAEIVGNLFYGLSLGSVLLLAALGLAITFGLMGIINMAHGELLMIGAYTTYVCQSLFRHYLPEFENWY
ncbi:MAG TPA: urea ABC transporter permease subunit UrtB, partial [Pseudoduganella sp.]